MSDNEIQTAFAAATLAGSISRSQRHGEIVHVEIGCTASNLRSLVSGIVPSDCDWNMCELDDNKVYVYGCSIETPKDKQVCRPLRWSDWRLTVQCQPTTV